MPQVESPDRIEPALLESVSSPIIDVITELSSKSATLCSALHSKTAFNLANLVRITNTYYSNLIEGNNTRPRDIERALAGNFVQDEARRNRQLEARAHVRLQAEIDDAFTRGALREPTSTDFLCYLHREFYKDATESMLQVRDKNRQFTMVPGQLRSQLIHDVEVGRHIPPSSTQVANFMNYFERRYAPLSKNKGAYLLAIPAAHHRLNYIHPFPDGNGRVSRLMSHAMSHIAGIGAHGLWSVSRGLARGLQSRTEYKQMMDYADNPRENDLDSRGNLSLKALQEFTLWFLQVCVDQVNFMSGLFDLNTLDDRLREYVEQNHTLKPQGAALLTEALIRGEFERGEILRITGLPERTARRVLKDIIDEGLLASDTPKGPLSLRFPSKTLDVLFPTLFLTV